MTRIPQIDPDDPLYISVRAFIPMCGLNRCNFYQRRKGRPHLPWPEVVAKVGKKQFYSRRDVEAFLASPALLEIGIFRREEVPMKPDRPAFDNLNARRFVSGGFDRASRQAERLRRKLEARSGPPMRVKVRLNGDGSF